MKIIEIILGIILFPFMLLIGLITGTFHAYESYHTIFLISTKDEYE